MNLLAKFFGGLRARSQKPAPVADRDLANELESKFANIIRDFAVECEPAQKQVAKAEYAAFVYYLVEDWHNRQTKLDRTYDTALMLLRYQAEKSASLIGFSVAHPEFHGKQVSAEEFFIDRVRIYNLISQDGDSEFLREPRLYRTLAKITSVSAGRYRLELMPYITNLAELELRAKLSKVDRREELEAKIAVCGFEANNNRVGLVIGALDEIYSSIAQNLQLKPY